jgi:hypothetical protein
MAAFLFQRFPNEICVVCCCGVCRIMLLSFCKSNLANVCQELFSGSCTEKKGVLNEPTRLRALKK